MSYKQSDIELGKRIKYIRSSLKMDQKSFANLIDATVSALSNWENGRNAPNDIRLKAIADIAGISVEELKYGNELERKKRNEDIEMWKRVLENHTNDLDSLQNLKDSNYLTNLMNITTKLENDISKIIDDINAGKLNLEGVKIKLDTLQTGLSEVSYNTYDDMKVLDANIASNKSTIDLANRKLEELGYTSASNDKTDAE
ncbi:helix-turn-helix domain-containing protein [Ruoffia sp. FAM 24228]|uniref:helix-turn-helix domain-containing protein n=1 Tax=Ruoffia sp. FAM 24228 TaxID=3259517 RepID=UPI00388568A8